VNDLPANPYEQPDLFLDTPEIQAKRTALMASGVALGPAKHVAQQRTQRSPTKPKTQLLKRAGAQSVKPKRLGAGKLKGAKAWRVKSANKRGKRK
jgi:hypothetical protein